MLRGFGRQQETEGGQTSPCPPFDDGGSAAGIKLLDGCMYVSVPRRQTSIHIYQKKILNSSRSESIVHMYILYTPNLFGGTRMNVVNQCKMVDTRNELRTNGFFRANQNTESYNGVTYN